MIKTATYFRQEKNCKKHLVVSIFFRNFVNHLKTTFQKRQDNG